MSDMPWFPMYAEKFQNSRKVKKMTAAQVGSYTLLLCEEWGGGPLPDNIKELARIGKTTQPKVTTILEICFTLTAKGWVNKRLEKVRREQRGKKAKASRDAKKAADARWEKQRAERDADALQAHSDRISDRMPIEKRRIEKKREDKKTTTTLDGEFEDFWKAYPQRSGGNPKDEALTRWRSVVKGGGVLPADILAGVERYNRYCVATGKINTEYVQQAVTFLGKKKSWTEDWLVTESDIAKTGEVHPSVQFNRDWEARTKSESPDSEPSQVGGLVENMLERIKA